MKVTIVFVALAVLAALWILYTKTEHFDTAAETASRVPSAMVIVEPRRHKHLAYVLTNFDKRMPLTYDMYIFHGRNNGEFARDAAKSVSKNRKIHFVALEKDDMTVDEYNALLKSPERFWSKIDAENILIFQTDAVLCSASKFSISDFEHLGYIGCAFGSEAGKGTYWGERSYWGVGGLSFRKKSAALKCIANMPHEPNFPEDVFFSECVDAGYGERPANGHQLTQFCSQGHFISKSFGAHRIHDGMEKSQLQDFVEYCPEVKPVLDQT